MGLRNPGSCNLLAKVGVDLHRVEHRSIGGKCCGLIDDVMASSASPLYHVIADSVVVASHMMVSYWVGPFACQLLCSFHLLVNSYFTCLFKYSRHEIKY